jgi:hypothetical protein
MKANIKNNERSFELNIYFNNLIQSIIFDIFIKIHFIQKILILTPEGNKYMKKKFGVSVFKIENIKERGKLVKTFHFIPNQKIKSQHNNKIDLFVKLFGFKIFKFNLTEVFKNNLINHYNFKDFIKNVKDLNKRVDKIYLKDFITKKDIIKNSFTNKEIINILKKHNNADNETVKRLRSLGVNLTTMIYSAYTTKDGIDVDKNKINKSLILYPAIYIKIFKKYNNQPDNVNHGFVVIKKSWWYKLYIYLKYINISKEKGYISTDGSFYNKKEALEIAYELGQINNNKISELNKNTL